MIVSTANPVVALSAAMIDSVEDRVDTADPESVMLAESSSDVTNYYYEMWRQKVCSTRTPTTGQA